MNKQLISINNGYFQYPLQTGKNYISNYGSCYNNNIYYNNYNCNIDYNSANKNYLIANNHEISYYDNYNNPKSNDFSLISKINSNHTDDNQNIHYNNISTDNNNIITLKKVKISYESIIPNEASGNKKPCGIINYGNNCFLNSGLQILSSCNKLIKELDKYKNIKSGLIGLLVDAFYKIFRSDVYDPIKLYNYFCKINNEALNVQYCSQNFIRKILKNLNDELLKYGDIHYITDYKIYKPRNQLEYQAYNKFLQTNMYFPESIAFRLFTSISKYHSYGICKYCHEKNEEFSFSYNIDQIIYLENIQKKCNFSKVLFENLGKLSNLTMNCKKCNQEIIIKEETKYIKLPDILIFTFERYKEIINNVEIIPEEIIDMKTYIDNSVNLPNTKYELFAINIRYGSTRDFGHEICQIKINFEWYEINDIKSYKREIEHNKNSYGLFYRRLLI